MLKSERRPFPALALCGSPGGGQRWLRLWGVSLPPGHPHLGSQLSLAGAEAAPAPPFLHISINNTLICIECTRLASGLPIKD